MAALPTGTVTFLFTDIEGSTRLWQEHPNAMAPVLARHDALLRKVIEEHSGHVFKTMGDAFLAAFQTSQDALDASIDAQRALRGESWGDVPPIRVRMALHTGEADERAGDYFGQPLNRCARLLSAGHGGQVLVTRVTAELAREALPVDAALKDLGEHRLRDLIRAERIYQLLHPDLLAEFPSLRGLQSFPNNLPLQTTCFVGRQQEMADVRVLVEAHRLVTLKAMGGCGKTRLALQVAADLLEEFPDGVWLVELAPITDGALVVQALATALGVKEQPGRPLLETLVEHLRGCRLLLLLDNCEHLVAECAQLADAVLRNCPHVKLLPTSREALGVPGEVVWNLAPLSIAADSAGKAAVDSEAARLFVERARAAQPRFKLVATNTAAIVEICRQLDGIPLAIELAAAWVKMLSPAEIAQRLSDKFRLLTDGSRTLLRRQQTLQALIDWSHVLLTGAEQRLFRRLAVFIGGWTLEAAEVVCFDQELPSGDVFELVGKLVDKSFVLLDETQQKSRYRFLETVREYAWQKMIESHEAERLRARHLDFFLKFAETADAHLTGAEQQDWLGCLEYEHDNFRAALRFAQTKSDNESNTLRLATALWYFWYVHGYYREGRGWLEAALAQYPNADPTLRADAFHGAGAQAYPQADYAASRLFYEQSLEIRRGLGDRRGVARLLNNLSLVARDQGDLRFARQMFEESLSVLREVGGSPNEISGVLNNLGSVARDLSDYPTARKLFEESLAIRRQLGDQLGVGEVLYNLGILERERGDHARAASLTDEALTIQRGLGNKRDMAWTLSAGLAELAIGCGDLAQARSLYEESLSLFREVGDQRGIASVLSGLGNICWRAGEWDLAVSRYQEALELFRGLADRLGTASVLDPLGTAALKNNDLTTARRHYTECLQLNIAAGHQRCTARSLETLAILSLAERDAMRAAHLYGAAASLREAIGAPLPLDELAEHEQHFANIRTQLGDTAFAAALAEGRTMTTDQAAATALTVSDS